MQSTKEARDQYLTNRWTSVYLPAAAKAKLRFQEDADEVDQYFRSDHGHLYDEIAKLMPSDYLVALTVNLAAQIRGYMGPHLYARHPIRTVSSAGLDTVTRYFAKVAQVYLNAIPYEVELKEEIRGSIDDALLAGRGVALVDKNKNLDVITTVQVPVDDLLIDPDARCLKDAQWIAIRYTEPLWSVKKTYKTGGENDPTKGLRYNSTSYMEGAAGLDKAAGRLLQLGDSRYQGQTSELCTYYKVWTKFGSGLLHGKGSTALDDGADVDLSREKGNRYRYLVIVPGHSKPLYEGDWPIPLHLDDDWPIGLLDFTPTRKGDKKDPLWPVSLMKLGLSHQKAIDVLCTILFNTLKFKSRVVAGVLGDKAEEVKEALTGGDLLVAVNIDPSDGVTDIRQVLQIMDLGSVPQELIPTIDWHERKFGEITGLLPLLKGVTPGNGDAQMRSAMEASVRDRNSRSRLEDMNERCESFNSSGARREFLAMRLVLTADEVERVVADKLPPAPFKIKVVIGAEALTVEEARNVWPPAGQYYDSKEEADKVASMLLQQYSEVLQMAWDATGRKEPFFLQANAIQVTLDELWLDTAGSTAEKLDRTYKVKIEAGSARRQDWNLLKDQAAFLMAEVGQRAAALGQWSTYNRTLDRVQETMQIPREERIYFDEQALQQQSQQAQQAEQEQMGQDHQRKAQLEIAKQDVKDRAKAQQIVLKGEVDSSLQSQQFAWQQALDRPGGGGWR